MLIFKQTHRVQTIVLLLFRFPLRFPTASLFFPASSSNLNLQTKEARAKSIYLENSFSSLLFVIVSNSFYVKQREFQKECWQCFKSLNTWLANREIPKCSTHLFLSKSRFFDIVGSSFDFVESHRTSRSSANGIVGL